MHQPHTPPPHPSASAATAGPQPRWWRWLARVVAHGLAGLIWAGSALLALVLAGAVAIVLWASTPVALPHTLGWAQQWLTDPATGASPLAFEGARGSLTHGGTVQGLVWSDAGLTVEVQGLELAWSATLWLGLLQRELHIRHWRMEHLRVTDQRAPTKDDRPDRPPPTQLLLPWLQQLDLPLQLQAFTLSGQTPLQVGPLQARYRYQAASGHTLDVTKLHWQDGVYALQAHVETAGPLALQLQLQGQLNTPALPDWPSQALAVNASLHGTLAGPEARLDLAAAIRPRGAVPDPQRATALALQARLRPWDAMPVAQASATLRHLNVAQFWPSGPITQLDGAWQAGPLPDTDGIWHISGELRNQLPRPWNEQGLPLERLQADLRIGPHGLELRQLTAQLGAGRLQAEGRFARASARSTARDSASDTARGAEGGTAASLVSGRIQVQQLEPRRVWSTLPAGRWQATAQASQQGGSTRWAVTAGPASDPTDPTVAAPAGRPAADLLPRLTASGRWASPQIAIERLALDWRGSRLTGTLESSTAAPSSAQAAAPSAGQAAAPWAAQADVQWVAPGLNMALRGRAAREAMDLQTEWALTDLQRFQRWSRDAIDAADAMFPALALRDQAAAWWATDLQGQATGQAQAQGPLAQMRWSSAFNTRLQADTGSRRWAVALETRVSGQRATTPDGNRELIRLETLQLQAGAHTHPLHWQLQLPEALELRIGPGHEVTVQAGQLHLQPVARPGTRTPVMAKEPAHLRWSALHGLDGHLASRGQLSGLPLSWANAWLASDTAPLGPLAAAGLSGDIWFDAEWDFHLPLLAGAAPDPHTPARAQWHLRHQRGDLHFSTGSGAETTTLRSGIETLQASARLQHDTLALSLLVQTAQLGRTEGQLSTPLTPPSATAGWVWAADAPLLGQLHMQWPNLGLLSPFVPPGWRVNGAVTAQASIGGTRQQPELQGHLHAQRLAIRSLLDGIDFSDGELLARLQGQQMVVDKLQLRGAGGAEGGLLEGSGQASWVQLADQRWSPRVDLRLQAQQWRLLARPDRRLTLSGDMRAHLAQDLLELTGHFVTDQALFLLPDEATPRLGTDVVVRGDPMPVPLHASLPFQTRLGVTVDLGQRFEVRGLGLQTALEGSLRVEAQPGQLTPSLTGDVRTVRGFYRAYGQRLNIERGLIRFNGPYDNPSLDILAIRPHPTQRVGVEIGGSAVAPRVRLVANPDLPDSEKLAWLVLGRPASGAGAEAALLQQAALAVLGGQGGQRDGTLAQNLGLDELIFQDEATDADGTVSAAALTLGKRLTDQLYVSYSRHITSAIGTVAVLLDLSRFLTLRAQAGDDNAIDIIYTRAFDRWHAPRTIAPDPP